MASKTVEDGLFPGIDVGVEGVSDSSGILVVEAVSTARPGRCPNCRKQGHRVHSTYQRTLDERPLGSRRVVIRPRVLLRPQELLPHDLRRAGTGVVRAVPAPGWRAGYGRSRSSSEAVPPPGCATGCG